MEGSKEGAVSLEFNIWAEIISSDVGFVVTVMTKEKSQCITGISSI